MTASSRFSLPVPRALAWGVLACLASLAALALASPAEAGPGSYRLGLVSGIVPDGTDLGAMRRARARSVRVVFSWDLIEAGRRTGRSCSTATYNFDRHDELVSEAGQRGLNLMPTFLDSPRYAQPNGARYPAPGTRAFGDFQCFVRAVVGRYGRGGSFAARDITDWQLWNEVNLPIYNPNRRIKPKRYGQLVKATAKTIRSRDRRATIILAGLPEKTKDGMHSNVFLRKLYGVKKIRSKFDAVALHPYAENARGTRGALIRLRRQLKRLHDRRRPVWITEIGYATDGPKGFFLVTSEKGQAKRLQSTLQMLRKNRRRFNVGTVHWFRHRDLASYSQNTNNWPDYAGLYRENGSPKPACHRFKRFTGAGGRCGRIRSGGGDGGLLPLLDLEPLAARADATLVPSPPE